MKLTLINEEASRALSKFPDNSIDLTVTSPPYDELREYGKLASWNYSSFLHIAFQLYRVTKEGGLVVWVVADQTKDGDESGNSFRQALAFKDIGFKLHDTMIYVKDPRFPRTNAYSPAFEYMFVLAKGNLRAFNPIKFKNFNPVRNKFRTDRQADGTLVAKRYDAADEYKPVNVWYYSSGYNKTTQDEVAYQHPAIFPEKLAEDHIKSWSNPGDIILDPFAGSGTVMKMASKLNRNSIGIEVDPKYIEIIKKRMFWGSGFDVEYKFIEGSQEAWEVPVGIF